MRSFSFLQRYFAANHAREEELKNLRSEPGLRGERNRMAYGDTDAELGMMAQAELDADRLARPWAFVVKFNPRGKKKGMS